MARLDEGLAAAHRLALLSAPAGFGKTTLLAAWAAACGRPVAWLSLDEGDSDPAVFLTGLVLALQTAAPGLGAAALAGLRAAQPPPAEATLTGLLNDIVALPAPLVLVLDDYHRIDSEPIDRAVAFVLDHLPSPLHLLIATREDPALPLARLRARGQLTELRAADLRFTPAEAAEFLNQTMGLNLSDADIAALDARTEGWIAGLQLAALSMRGRADVASFVRAFAGSHRFVLDYLVEEVLQNQPDPVRDFLLQTAVLDRLCAPLVDAVTGRAGGAVMLATLERGNLFLAPLDDQRQWYRYHHLFADVLRARLRGAHPERVADLHRRAGAWHERHGFPADAIHHTLAAGDFDRAAALIERAWPAAEQGDISPALWLGWVGALPDASVQARPALCVWHAFALLGMGDLEAAAGRLADAERGPAAGEMVAAGAAPDESLPAAVAVARAYIAQALGQPAAAVDYAGRALALAPAGEQLRRGQAAMLLGIAHWTGGDLAAADRVFAAYSQKLHDAGNMPDAISTTAVLADIRLALGRLREATGAVEACLQFITRRGAPVPPDTADLHRALSALHLEQGDPAAAAKQLERAGQLGQDAQPPVLRYRLWVARACLHESQGNLDDALAALEAAERLYVRSPLPDFRPIAAMRARLWAARGRLPQALAWARERGLSPDDDLAYLREYDHITLARVLIARHQHDRAGDALDEAARLLERLLSAAEAGGRMGSVIELLILSAVAHQARGRGPAARAALERALVLAEPEGYVRVFVAEGEALRALLERQARRDHPSRGYARRLVAAFLAPAAPPAPGLPAADRLEPLSDREMQVLRLRGSDLSGPEIARELVVSLSTLRSHTQNIYAKLGVNNRRAAVRRATELHLL